MTQDWKPLLDRLDGLIARLDRLAPPAARDPDWKAAAYRWRKQARGSWLELAGVTRNNLRGLDVAFPLGAFTSVPGVSGSGKSSLVSQALVGLGSAAPGHAPPGDSDGGGDAARRADPGPRASPRRSGRPRSGRACRPRSAPGSAS